MRASRSRVIVAVAVAALVLPLMAMAGPAAAATPDPRRVSVRFAVTLRGLVQPTGVVSPHDGTGRLFILEKAGRIRVVQRGRLLAAPYLDIRSLVSTVGEQGLLGLAFHPDFRRGHIFWVTYAAKDGSLQIARFVASSYAANTVSAATRHPVLGIPHPTYTNHYGGHLAFGGDNLLYISTGDGGGSGDPFGNAQNPRSRLGKILRIDPFRSCSGRIYCVPATNPHVNVAGAAKEVWLWGLRNAWQFSRDRATNTWWIGDVGQSRQEEIDIVSGASRGGSLGWSCKEGRLIYNRARCLPGVWYPSPPVAYGRTIGTTVTGGLVYRGRAYARLLAGIYVFGDFGTGQVMLYRRGGPLVLKGRLLTGVTSFGSDDAGEIWAVTIDGRLAVLRASAA